MRPMQQKLKALLVDDELPASETLIWMLREYCPEVEVQGFVQSADAARKFLLQYTPNVVFLDISMPGENGFEFLQSLPEQNFAVIFVTAHNEYAIKAFRENAVDYLLKPVDAVELQEAIKKTSLRLQAQDTGYFKAVQTLLKTMSPSQNIHRIAVPHSEGVHFIPVDEIEYMEADSNYTIFHLVKGTKIVASKTMSDFEVQLPEYFFRIHKSFSVNLRKVQEFVKKDGNSVLMSDGSMLPVSRRKVQELMQVLLTS